MIPAPLQHISPLLHESQHSNLSYMILFAIFIKALLIPLFGRALSSKSSALNSSLASVTLGASISVKSGARCPKLSRRDPRPAAAVLLEAK